MADLQADVYVAPSVPAKSATGASVLWSPISCTLIRGKSSAVLVDTPITIKQTSDLADWIENLIPHKNLTHIFITHGHGDHCMGIKLIPDRFPGVKAVATLGTVAHMKQQFETVFFAKFWRSLFPEDGILPPVHELVIAEPLPSNEINLEGYMLRAIDVGFTDTESTSILHVPDLHLVVAGDVVYGDVHQYLVEANTKEKREEWIKAIELVESLKPHTVVPGHKRLGAVDGVHYLESSKQYILDFQRFLDEGISDLKELFGKMLEKHGGRLEGSRSVLFGSSAATIAGTKKTESRV
jgi:glyoxylase-like metal-dependent hydrolase (beta-lactamase superfamily II)